MAVRATTVILSEPTLLARGENERHKVRLQANVDITVGGTDSDCTYPVMIWDKTNITEFCVTLHYGEELWADGTGDVNILETGI